MTTRRPVTIRLLALTLTVLAPLAGCDERTLRVAERALAQPDVDRDGKRDSYRSFLDDEGGRALALRRLNGGDAGPSTPALAERVEREALAAGRFATDAGGFAARVGEEGQRETKTPRPPTDARALAAALPARAALDPAVSPALLAILSGEPAEGFAAWAKPPEPEDGPHLFAAERWQSFGLAAQRGVLPSPLPEPHGPSQLTGHAAPPPPPTADVGGYANAAMHLLRYACCDDVVVRADAADDAPVVATLAKSQLVWLVDLLPSTGLQSAVTDLDECRQNGDCRSVVTEIAQTSNVDYFAKIFVPDLGVAGYVDFPALFVRPVGDAAGELTLETGFDRIASSMQQGLQATFQGGSCGDSGNSVNVKAYAHDLFYDPTSQVSTRCDDALACPDWKIVSCEGLVDDDEGFDACRYTAMDQCGGPAPAGEASASKSACVRNVCPGKSTCGSCREWFEATNQDQTGWRTELDLVAQCEAEVIASSDDDDLPLFCLGSTKENCVAACKDSVHAENVNACSRYIAAHDSRTYADPTDYECGEIPIAETHPRYWYYSNIGEWSGEWDYDWKELESFPLFSRTHVFEMGRIGSQTPISFVTPDLTDQGAAHEESLGSEMTARNVWLSLAPAVVDGDVFDWLEDESRSALMLNVCAHVPGITVRGPDVDYEPGDTPFFLISHIDFGGGSIDRADLCAFGAATVDDALEPKMRWLDASLALAGVEYGGIEVNKGPGFWLLAAASRLVPFVGEILAHVVLSSVFLEEIAEGIVNFTDLDSWLIDFLLRTYEAKVTDKLLDQLNEQTTDAMAKLDLDAAERLANVCEELDPGVSQNHPYYWFYRHLRAECERVTASATVDPLVANAASEEQGCYGASQLFTPDDAGEGHWWQQYRGQEWYFGWIPDEGCRVATRVEAVADAATWPVLRCATAAFNAWHNGLVMTPDATTSGLGFLKTDAAPPTEQEQFETLGALGFMVKEMCGAVGHMALEQLYGDGADVAELWHHNHGAPDPGLQGN